MSMQQIVVSNITNAPVTHIPVLIDRSSPLSNPFVRTGRKYTDSVTEMYRQYVWKACRSDAKQYASIRVALRNLVRMRMTGAPIALVFHAKDAGKHGEVLVRFVEWAVTETAKNVKARVRKSSK